MDNMQTQELISALADGQLQGEAFARGVEAVAADPAARQAWHTYHLIGEVLRSGEHAAARMNPEFLTRLQSRLQAEPQPRRHPGVADTVPSRAARREPANDASFRWKVVAGFASMAAVAAIGWTLATGPAPGAGQAQLAQAPGATVLAGSERGVMIRDPHLDEFLAAHRQLGGATALQTPAGFLRNATYEGPIR